METAGTASPAEPASGSERRWRSKRASHDSHACLLRRRLSIPPARSAVPCLASAFYLRDLCASAFPLRDQELFDVNVEFEIVLTDRPAYLTGYVRDAKGEAFPLVRR